MSIADKIVLRFRTLLAEEGVEVTPDRLREILKGAEARMPSCPDCLNMCYLPLCFKCFMRMVQEG